jgi:hypothetical protein
MKDGLSMEFEKEAERRRIVFTNNRKDLLTRMKPSVLSVSSVLSVLKTMDTQTQNSLIGLMLTETLDGFSLSTMITILL